MFQRVCLLLEESSKTSVHGFELPSMRAKGGLCGLTPPVSITGSASGLRWISFGIASEWEAFCPCGALEGPAATCLLGGTVALGSFLAPAL